MAMFCWTRGQRLPSHTTERVCRYPQSSLQILEAVFCLSSTNHWVPCRYTNQRHMGDGPVHRPEAQGGRTGTQTRGTVWTAGYTNRIRARTKNKTYKILVFLPWLRTGTVLNQLRPQIRQNSTDWTVTQNQANVDTVNWKARLFGPHRIISRALDNEP